MSLERNEWGRWVDPTSLDKHPRIESRKYLDWVATLPCADCQAEDGTVVAHHLKGRFSPFSGGAGWKANDYFVMPLCYEHHTDIHNGDTYLLDWQPYFIMETLDKAFYAGLISFNDK